MLAQRHSGAGLSQGCLARLRSASAAANRPLAPPAAGFFAIASPPGADKENGGWWWVGGKGALQQRCGPARRPAGLHLRLLDPPTRGIHSPLPPINRFHAGVVELLIKSQGGTAEQLCAAAAGAQGSAGYYACLSWCGWLTTAWPCCKLAIDPSPAAALPTAAGAGTPVLVSAPMGKGFPVDAIPPADCPTVLIFATGSGGWLALSALAALPRPLLLVCAPVGEAGPCGELRPTNTQHTLTHTSNSLPLPPPHPPSPTRPPRRQASRPSRRWWSRARCRRARARTCACTLARARRSTWPTRPASPPGRRRASRWSPSTPSRAAATCRTRSPR